MSPGSRDFPPTFLHTAADGPNGTEGPCQRRAGCASRGGQASLGGPEPARGLISLEWSAAGCSRLGKAKEGPMVAPPNRPCCQSNCKGRTILLSSALPSQ
jgi:hypothetical protein